MKTTVCQCGQVISVGDYVPDEVLKENWHCRDGMVSCNRIRGRAFYLVHQVTPHAAPLGFVWDHKDRNPHNNTLENLRLATNTQNQGNSGPKSKRSGYKGVSWNKNTSKWRAHITIGGKFHHLGLFDNIEEAAVVYNNAAIKHFGEFACLNVLPWPNSVFQGPPKPSDIPKPMMTITP